MINSDTLKRKMDRLDKDISRLEDRGGRFEDAERCIRVIDWLWKFKYITKEQMDQYADRMIFVLEERISPY